MTFWITYLLIGLLIVLIVDYSMARYEPDNILSNSQRFIMALIWPISIIIFIYFIIKGE
jgi:hypothetical protein